MEAMMDTPPIMQRVHQHWRFVGGAAKEDQAKDHRRNDGDRIGFEQVSGHTGAIADIVANVIRDNGRVTGVIFRDAGFDLTNQGQRRRLRLW